MYRTIIEYGTAHPQNVILPRDQCCTPPFIYKVGGVLVKMTGGVRRRGIVSHVG